MKKSLQWSALALAVSAATVQLAHASTQSEAQGFVEDSSLVLLNKNFYWNHDRRDGDAKTQEWAHGMLLNYESGFTQGTVGFGIDAHAGGAIKLDGGSGVAGNTLMGRDSSGDPHDNWGFAGGAVKLRVSNTVLKYGDLIPTSPVFSPATTRLFAGTARGFQVTSSELDKLTLDAGYFTALRDRNATTNRDGRISMTYAGGDAKSASYLGGTYALSDNLSATLYAANYEDYWDQYYANLYYVQPLTDTQSLSFDFNVYDGSDEGTSEAGDINYTIWSLAVGYSIGAHTFTVAHQQNNGNAPLDYISMDGTNAGDSIYVANSAQWSDFNLPGQKSVQLRYNLDMAAYGVPGLSFMAKYIKGDIDTMNSIDPNGAYAAWYLGGSGKEWERDVDVKYVVQEGSLKDLSFRVRWATARGYNGDVEQVRVITEYPLSIL